MDTIFSIKLQQSKDRQQRIKKSRDRLINDSRQTLKWNWMIMDMQKEEILLDRMKNLIQNKYGK